MANFSVSQLQQIIEMIGKLHEKIDVIKAESLQWKEAAPWMPQAVPDLEDWVRKLASTSSYTERAWRDLAKGVTRDAILRPSSGDEGNKSSVLEQGKEKKRRASSRPEDPKPKTRKALKEARELKTPDIGVGSGAADPFKDCFTGVDDSSDIGDASLLLEEAQRFITRAIGRFRVDLSQCEAELWKVLGEINDLRLLCSKKEEAIKDLQTDLAKVREERVELDQQVSLVLLKYGFDSTVEVNPSLSQLQQKIEKIGLLREEVDQIRAECNQWKETIDRLAAEKENILTKLLSADVQLRNVKQKVSVQAKKIDELEIRRAEAKAEVESSKVLADKSIAVYRADVEAAQWLRGSDAWVHTEIPIDHLRP
ncbi:autophagy-related protein 23-like [Nicotiana tomentosiformis]|uniref:autophagy-related protein 23-like n=1 Tax=Nicotiana tomentosiformis TaxID=4098 RepID=UPI00388CD0CB